MAPRSPPASSQRCTASGESRPLRTIRADSCRPVDRSTRLTNDKTPRFFATKHHENSGAAFIKAHFGPEVYEPVRLHVAAKRYLTAVEPDARAKLSEPSIVSLQLQGGPPR